MQQVWEEWGGEGGACRRLAAGLVIKMKLAAGLPLASGP